jgi:hypothetical protein
VRIEKELTAVRRKSGKSMIGLTKGRYTASVSIYQQAGRFFHGGLCAQAYFITG